MTMEAEPLDAILSRVSSALPPGWEAVERGRAYHEGIRPEIVTVAVDYDAQQDNPHLLTIGVDLDVWAPDSKQADDIAFVVESSLNAWAVNTGRSGMIRLWAGSREAIDTDNDAFSRITMRLNGRGFRRTS